MIDAFFLLRKIYHYEHDKKDVHSMQRVWPGEAILHPLKKKKNIYIYIYNILLSLHPVSLLPFKAWMDAKNVKRLFQTATASLKWNYQFKMHFQTWSATHGDPSAWHMKLYLFSCKHCLLFYDFSIIKFLKVSGANCNYFSYFMLTSNLSHSFRKILTWCEVELADRYMANDYMCQAANPVMISPRKMVYCLCFNLLHWLHLQDWNGHSGIERNAYPLRSRKDVNEIFKHTKKSLFKGCLHWPTSDNREGFILMPRNLSRFLW